MGGLKRIFNGSLRSIYDKKIHKNNVLNTFKGQSYSTDAIQNSHFDVVVVGGGIVGTASAREILLRHPNLNIAIVEKENNFAQHQTGNNSGVIHAGIYYKPGTLKARLCVEGMKKMYKYCDAKNIPYKKCGKLIVATNPTEVERLEDLMRRGIQNNVPDLKMIDGSKIKEIEPYCVGLKAIHSPQTGIVDYKKVTESYADDFKKASGKVFFDFQVKSFNETTENSDYPVTLSSTCKSIHAKYVLTCCGLQSDEVAVLSGCSPNPIIVPFRGEYLLLNPKKTNLIKGNIYPVPDPRFPFLGVHFTPRIDGSVILGPNAVLALKREGYRWSDINAKELLKVIRHSGFQKLAFKYTTFGFMEMVRSVMPSLQVKELQKFIPQLTNADVSPGIAGVRAQAMADDGSLVDDFVFDGSGTLSKRVLHCRNAPSPGATSSLAIAELIADKMEEQFKLG